VMCPLGTRRGAADDDGKHRADQRASLGVRKTCEARRRYQCNRAFASISAARYVHDGRLEHCVNQQARATRF